MAMMTGVLGLRASRAPRVRVSGRVAQSAEPVVQPVVEPAAGLSLADLAKGQAGVVVAVRDDGDPAVARRLVDLGFAPGTEVRMLRRAPLQDPVVFRVAGYDIALRRVQASCIKVDPAP